MKIFPPKQFRQFDLESLFSVLLARLGRLPPDCHQLDSAEIRRECRQPLPVSRMRIELKNIKWYDIILYTHT